MLESARNMGYGAGKNASFNVVMCLTRGDNGNHSKKLRSLCAVHVVVGEDLFTYEKFRTEQERVKTLITETISQRSWEKMERNQRMRNRWLGTNVRLQETSKHTHKQGTDRICRSRVWENVTADIGVQDLEFVVDSGASGHCCWRWDTVWSCSPGKVQLSPPRTGTNETATGERISNLGTGFARRSTP